VGVKKVNLGSPHVQMYQEEFGASGVKEASSDGQKLACVVADCGNQHSVERSRFADPDKEVEK